MDELVNPQSEVTTQSSVGKQLNVLKSSPCCIILPLTWLYVFYWKFTMSFTPAIWKKSFINIITFKLKNFQMP